MNVHERFKEYQGEKCWQAHIADVNRQEDIENCSLTQEELDNLKTGDFEFDYVDKEDKYQCNQIKDFIKRHEWLGKLSIWVTHRFTARHKRTKQLAGVVIMATPNSFSFLLGKEKKDTEKLISRGACISWSPKNLASWLIMNSIKWMVHNTDFRYFTAYSDPEAKELGTIYQSCNFIYLGKKYGAGYQYLDPNNLERGWFGSSGFADRSQIVRYAKQLGIEWQQEWYKVKKSYRKVNWKAIPEDIAKRLKETRELHKKSCQKRKSPIKHKYVYILGRNKRETKQLIQTFKELNPELVGLSYPKNRGDLN